MEPNQIYNAAYHRYLVSLMRFRDGIVYDNEHIFGRDHLLKVTADDVVRWMRFEMFGVRDAVDVVEGMEFKLRSGTIEMMKKAVSWYMPSRTANWDEINGIGNPTRSTAVNNFLRAIKQGECRKLGKPSNAKDPLNMAMFRCALKVLESNQNDFRSYYRYTAMCKFQYHLIARCDDMGNFKILDLRSHSNPLFSSFALQTKVYWSKNVFEERDCPDQILLGSYDPDFCLLLSLGLYLEQWFIVGNGVQCELLFADEPGNTKAIVDRLKSRYRNYLTNSVFSNPLFVQVSQGKHKKVGSHSFRKFPASYARNNGCTLDEIEQRGRWRRNTRRVVDRYIDVEQQWIDGKVAQQWIDGKVAGALCVGGPVRYVAAADCGVTKNWLLENVVPGIASFYNEEDNNIAEVLGLAVLWACYDPVAVAKVPGWLLDHVRTAYGQLMEVQPGQNPVDKRKLFVFPMSGQLCIQDAAGGGGGAQGVAPGPIPAALTGGVSSDNVDTQVFQMLSQVNQQLTDVGGG